MAFNINEIKGATFKGAEHHYLRVAITNTINGVADLKTFMVQAAQIMKQLWVLKFLFWA